MADHREDISRRIGAAVARGVWIWVIATSALFVAVKLSPITLVHPGRAGGPWLLTPGESTLVQYVEWLWSTSTLGYGLSIHYGTPIRDLLLAKVGASVAILATTAVVGGALIVGAMRLVETARANGADRLVAVPAYLLSGAPPFLTVALLELGVQSLAPGGLRWRIGEANVLLSLVLGTAIALPFVGLAARRYQLLLDARGIDGTDTRFRELIDPVVVRTGSTWLWLALGYVAGSLVIVETMVDVPGLGSLIVTALTNQDLPLSLGVVGTTMLVLLGGRVLGKLLLLVAFPTGGRPDSGPTVGDDQPTSSDGGRTHPTTVRAVLDADPRVRIGAAGFAVVLAVGLLGGGLVPTSASSDLPVHVLNTLGTTAIVALLGGLVALGGRAGWRALTDSRGATIPAVVGPPRASLLVVPPQLLLVMGMQLFFIPSSRTGFELLVGTVAGLVVLALVGAGDEVIERTAGTRWRAGHVPDRVTFARILGRTACVLPVACFLAAEFAFIGLTRETLTGSSFILLFGLVEGGASFEGTFVLGGAVAAYVAVALPVVTLSVLGDGLGAAAIELADARDVE